MHNLIQIYICPKHGEVDARYYIEIDTLNDETIPMMMCAEPFCTYEVRPKTTPDGYPCYREMTEEEILQRDCDDYDLPF